jgi:hypothetical protein
MTDIPIIQADPNLALYPRVINNFLYLGINNTKPPFDNEQVRQANQFIAGAARFDAPRPARDERDAMPAIPDIADGRGDRAGCIQRTHALG